MTEQRGPTVRHASVVLVSPSPIDPQSVRPEILSNAGVVPAGWVSANNINTPVLALVQYQNGITIRTEGNRCVFQETTGDEFRERYEVHPLAKRYVEATRLVPYNALGVNWLMDIAVPNPGGWIHEKILSNHENFPGFTPTSMQMAKVLDFAVCNLILKTGKAGIEVDCNYHFKIEGRSVEIISETLDSWQKCQDHLTNKVLPQL